MPRVLVVDDNQKVRESFQFALPISGYEAVAVSNFAEAREVLSNQSVAVIILDIDLNGESGLMFLKTLRKDGLETPVIIFSGSITPQVELDLKEAGANEIIDKGNGILIVIEKAQHLLSFQCIE